MIRELIGRVQQSVRRFAQTTEVSRTLQAEPLNDGVFLSVGTVVETTARRPKKFLGWLAPPPAPPTSREVGPCFTLQSGVTVMHDSERKQVLVTAGGVHNPTVLTVVEEATLKVPSADSREAVIESPREKQIVRPRETVIEDKQRGGVDEFHQEILHRGMVIPHAWGREHFDTYVISQEGAVQATQYLTARTGRAYQVLEARPLQAAAQLDAAGAIVAKHRPSNATLRIVPFVTTQQMGTPQGFTPIPRERALVKYVPPA